MDLSYFETVNDGEVVVNRPETKSLADLERVIGLGKSESVINSFAEMVTLGEQMAWYD
jgi:septum formation inhibitor-activating ATPase MinD